MELQEKIRSKYIENGAEIPSLEVRESEPPKPVRTVLILKIQCIGGQVFMAGNLNVNLSEQGWPFFDSLHSFYLKIGPFGFISTSNYVKFLATRLFFPGFKLVSSDIANFRRSTVNVFLYF